MSEDIKRRIAKMLALANDKGASEDEAATAMRMAMGLMARHGLTQNDLPQGDKPKTKRGEIKRFRFDKYEVVLANAAGHLYGCKVIFYGGGKDGLLFVGRPDNIDAAEMTMVWLTQQLERLYKAALPSGLTQRHRADFRKTFKWACAVRVEQRVVNMMEDLLDNDKKALAATGATALVVQGHFKQLLAEVDQELRGIPQKIMKQRVGSGTDAGRAAGDQVKLRQEVGAERKLLNG